MSFRYASALAAILGLASTSALADTGLTLKDAQRMADRAVEAAGKLGREVSVVVVNREGRVIVAQRMDGASYMSLEVARAKAETSAALGAPTSALEAQLARGDHSALSVPGALTIAGGVPVIVGGAPVAGVGVSGGAPFEDEQAATAARDVLTSAATPR